MKISNQVSGRFGNNLFQYIATKILQHKLSREGFQYSYVYNSPLNDPYIVAIAMLVEKHKKTSIPNAPKQRITVLEDSALQMEDADEYIEEHYYW